MCIVVSYVLIVGYFLYIQRTMAYARTNTSIWYILLQDTKNLQSFVLFGLLYFIFFRLYLYTCAANLALSECKCKCWYVMVWYEYYECTFKMAFCHIFWQISFLLSFVVKFLFRFWSAQLFHIFILIFFAVALACSTFIYQKA